MIKKKKNCNTLFIFDKNNFRYTFLGFFRILLVRNPFSLVLACEFFRGRTMIPWDMRWQRPFCFVGHWTNVTLIFDIEIWVFRHNVTSQCRCRGKGTLTFLAHSATTFVHLHRDLTLDDALFLVRMLAYYVYLIQWDSFWVFIWVVFVGYVIFFVCINKI